MKTLILVFAILISSFSFTQVITVSYTKTKVFNSVGDHTSTDHLSLAKSKPIYDVGGSTCLKVIDLNDNMFYFYENQILTFSAKIKSYEKNKNTYKILIDDTNIFTGLPLVTYQYIDVSKNESFYGWYYDFTDTTWLNMEYDNKITVSK